MQFEVDIFEYRKGMIVQKFVTLFLGNGIIFNLLDLRDYFQLNFYTQKPYLSNQLLAV